ncbi:hypothetical protein [Duganella violaceipulchra]|uniref:Uncharacterized protein n=1 Tax=Duganella violaceipulchra TaxID=2849652 RepID=A0AA41L6L4_9BURK|nr:hypothetical protein [Duganella violaceicalia]MBV6323427.1 hypothetical protein [Duganella violaceicalia]MCP2007619.1 hypothetical protein [Duganella violaceicalia]
MPRALKAFSQVEPRAIQLAVPKSNQFKLDLAGLHLTEEQLTAVRSEAVKAAMLAAAGLLRGNGKGSVLEDFGTFSTFSTFSTFGSGAAFGGRPMDIVENINNPIIGKVIGRVE